MRNTPLFFGLTLLAFSILRAGLPIETKTPVVVAAQTGDACDVNPPDDYRQSIRAPVDGDELVLTVSARFAGAVESLTWRGKEFINIFDHGRQISYAWQMDGYGECYNPTEPGTASDLFSPFSTSELLEVCRPAENVLTTVNQPAFWLAPGETGFCDKSETAFNETLLSDQTLEKTIEIGYAGIDNVIAFTATITTPSSYNFLQAELPTGYLRHDFTSYWVYDPATEELFQPESEPLVEPWSFVYTTRYPPILATEDGAYAMGAYTVEDFTAYEILFYDVADPEDRTNKWNVVLHERPWAAGEHTYTSFVVVGTLESVIEGLDQLFVLHPSDFQPPEGYIDLANCEVVDGWAWDPKFPDEPVEVEVRIVNPDGSETLLAVLTADRFRTDLADALGDNGRHGFSLPGADFIPDGEPHTYRFYARNANPNLLPAPLIPAEQDLTCPQYRPTAVPPPTTAVPVPTATGVPAEPDSGGGALPCAGGFLPLLPVVVLLVSRRRKKRSAR